jgi:DNA-binding PadR family transcriptional regulator
MNPGAGTLYAAVQRMLDAGLVDETDDRPAVGDDERRRYYRLTEYGRHVARAEALRMRSDCAWHWGRRRAAFCVTCSARG